jgi:hypothetical protein
MERAAIIRDALRREGLGGADLEAAVLAYKVANNLPLNDAPDVVDDEADAETIKMKQFITSFARHMFEPNPFSFSK